MCAEQGSNYTLRPSGQVVVASTNGITYIPTAPWEQLEVLHTIMHNTYIHTYSVYFCYYLQLQLQFKTTSSLFMEEDWQVYLRRIFCISFIFEFDFFK